MQEHVDTPGSIEYDLSEKTVVSFGGDWTNVADCISPQVPKVFHRVVENEKVVAMLGGEGEPVRDSWLPPTDGPLYSGLMGELRGVQSHFVMVVQEDTLIPDGMIWRVEKGFRTPGLGKTCVFEVPREQASQAAAQHSASPCDDVGLF